MDSPATATTKRAQWLRAAILGSSDGLLSTTSLMLGVGAAREDRMSMLVSGIAGAIAGAFSMAVGEFISVSTQRDIEISTNATNKKTELPSPVKAAAASGISFMAGAVVPLLSSAFITRHVVRVAVIVTVASVMLVGFGAIGARFGGAPAKASAVRVLVGGWVAMGITYCILIPFDDDKD